MSNARYNILKSDNLETTGTINISGNVTADTVVTRDLICSDAVGLSLINGTYTITARIHLPRLLVQNITTSFQNGNYGYQDDAINNLVVNWNHPLPNNDITWDQFVVGKDNEQAGHTAGEVRFVVNGATQSTDSYSGISIETAKRFSISSPFTTTAGDNIRIQGRRTNGGDGVELYVHVWGYYTPSS